MIWIIIIINLRDQLIDEQFPHIDFVDINCGCPIDLIYNQGMGSGLMDRKNKMQGKIF